MILDQLNETDEVIKQTEKEEYEDYIANEYVMQVYSRVNESIAQLKRVAREMNKDFPDYEHLVKILYFCAENIKTAATELDNHVI